MSVVGARPQFVKLCPVDRAFRTAGVDHEIVHTGQHYDADMSAAFFRDLRIPEPDVHLDVGSASHGAQTGAILTKMDPVLEEHKPDWVLVYGDTNSTLAAAIAAVKCQVPVAHLEAGLRSFNRKMPEEHNRVLVDHAADLLLAPTATAMQHLATEGLARRSALVGDVMTDVCYQIRDEVKQTGRAIDTDIDLTQPYVVATIHRAENTDDERRLAAILGALRSIRAPVLLLVHPRLKARSKDFDLALDGGSLHPSRPLGYPELVHVVVNAAGVVTDSGGLQKEAFLLEVPCTTLRTETEWPETLTNGWNVLDPDLASLQVTAVRALPDPVPGAPYGSGDAAHRVVRAIAGFQE